MENINQIESGILSKIKNVSDRNSYERIKTEILVKKELSLNFLKKSEAWTKVRERNMLQSLIL